MMNRTNLLSSWSRIALAAGAAAGPASFGNAWVRIADLAAAVCAAGLGLNIVVGYAGLLDLGYVAFFAVGAYMYGLLASPHLTRTSPLAAHVPERAAHPLWLVIPLAAGLAGLFGVLLGAPTLKLRGDYLAIVTLGFGEIIRVFLNNLDHPSTSPTAPRAWPDRLGQDLRLDLGKPLELFGFDIASVTLYYYLFLALVVFSVVICHRLQTRASAAPGWPSARTRSPPRPWASTPAT
jgi:branched-chain amino acid transport system permease protein